MEKINEAIAVFLLFSEKKIFNFAIDIPCTICYN